MVEPLLRQLVGTRDMECDVGLDAVAFEDRAGCRLDAPLGQMPDRGQQLGAHLGSKSAGSRLIDSNLDDRASAASELFYQLMQRDMNPALTRGTEEASQSVHAWPGWPFRRCGRVASARPIRAGSAQVYRIGAGAGAGWRRSAAPAGRPLPPGWHASSRSRSCLGTGGEPESRHPPAQSNPRRSPPRSYPDNDGDAVSVYR